MEILDKLNFLMAHTYLMVDGKVVTVMDLWQEQQVKVPKSCVPNWKELKEYAFRTSKFKVEGEGVVIEYSDGCTYVMPLKEFAKDINE